MRKLVAKLFDAQLLERLTIAETALKIAEDRAHLVDIESEGRLLKFTFVRNGEVHTIECFGTWSDDVEGWRKALLCGKS